MRVVHVTVGVSIAGIAIAFLLLLFGFFLALVPVVIFAILLGLASFVAFLVSFVISVVHVWVS